MKLIDSSLWIDQMRAHSSGALKAFVQSHTTDPQACVAEPIVFELFRNASELQFALLKTALAAVPMLSTPTGIWSKGAELGQLCRRAGLTIGALDLIIASVALHHDAEVVTFDNNFRQIASVTPLRVNFLRRPE